MPAPICGALVNFGGPPTFRTRRPEVATAVNTSAFLGTYPTDEPKLFGLHVTRESRAFPQATSAS